VSGRVILEILFIGQVIVAFLTALQVLTDRRARAATATSWILLIAVLPVIGCCLYWLAGKPWLQQRRRDLIERQRERLGKRMDTGRALRAKGVRAALDDMPVGTRGLAALACAVSGLPPVGGNDVEYLADADDLFVRIAGDIDGALDHVHVLFYIVVADRSSRPVLDAMIRAARRGVRVRFLVDSIGGRGFLRSNDAAALREAGVHLVEALPAGLLRALFQRIDLRNHRKVVIIDGKIGYVGSHNLAASDFKVGRANVEWVDATARIEGPAANELQRVFVEDWWVETEEPVEHLVRPPSGGDSGAVVQVMATGPTVEEQSMSQVMATCLHLAQREIILTTPYFVPDEPTMISIITAARRGVRVTLVIPEHNDSYLVKLASQSYFERLLEAGVRLLEFSGGMLHSKTITVDDALGVMTSANLDRRSFEINFEVSLILYDADATQAMRAMQESYIERSTRIDPIAWSGRSWWRRLVANAVGLASPVL
jgi:cardiolipin synthase